MQAKIILESKGINVHGDADDNGVVAVAPDARVVDVARMFKENRIGFALVRADSGDGWLGTVSERDIVQALASLSHGPSVIDQPVRDILTQNMVTCAPDDALDTIRELMTERRTRHVVVTADGLEKSKVLGLVSIGDLIKHQLEQSRVETAAMRDYVTGVGYQ